VLNAQILAFFQGGIVPKYRKKSNPTMSLLRPIGQL